MENTGTDQNPRPNPDPQSEDNLEGDITPSQEQPRLLSKPPKSLIDWLVQINMRLMGVKPEEHNTG